MEEDEKDQVCPRSGGERAENRREAQRSEGQRDASMLWECSLEGL